MVKTIKTKHRIVHGSSTQLNEVGYATVDLVVTSPPYGDVKEYDRANESNIGNYKDDEYRELMKAVYKECKRVLKPGRRMCINISDIPVMTKWGQAVGMYGQMTTDLIEEIGGFVLNNIIIWTKGRCRAGSDAVGSLPYPGAPVLLNNWEYIYIFKKHGTPVYQKDKDLRQASIIVKEELRDWLYCTWAIRPERDRRHIAPYPPEIPRRIIRLFTFIGDTVYDPFLGSGTTMKVARELGRNSVGYDIGYDLTKDARKSLGNSPTATWLDLIKSNVGWGQQMLEPIRELVLPSPIIYKYIEDEVSLSSVSNLIREQDLEVSDICNLDTSGDMPGVGENIPLNDVLKVSEVPVSGITDNSCGITQLDEIDDLRPFNGCLEIPNKIPTVMPRRVDVNSQYVTVENGRIVWLDKGGLYPFLEVI